MTGTCGTWQKRKRFPLGKSASPTHYLSIIDQLNGRGVFFARLKIWKTNVIYGISIYRKGGVAFNSSKTDGDSHVQKQRFFFFTFPFRVQLTYIKEIKKRKKSASDSTKRITGCQTSDKLRVRLASIKRSSTLYSFLLQNSYVFN